MENLFVAAICFAFINLLLFVIGFISFKQQLMWLGWALLPVCLIFIYLMFQRQHAIIKMLALISTTFTGMKVIVTAHSYRMDKYELSFMQWLLFCLGWAGMQPKLFACYGDKPLKNAWPMIIFGLKRIAIGLALIFLVHKLLLLGIDPTLSYFFSSVILLVAFSLILHFGLLSISAGIWRFSGVNTGYLFRSPLKSNSLTEFWSRRWNLAFSEMTSIAIYRPLKAKIGQTEAVFASFAFSGILHEIALSVPVNSGFGFPFLYFLIHGCLVIFEKLLINNRILILQQRVIRKIWVFFWLVVPAPLLFHQAFINKVIWPLAGISLK